MISGMSPFIAELVGTMVLVTLGDGVVAHVLLQKSKGYDSGWLVIAIGWALAVTVAVYLVNPISGAHLNPAITIGLASIGKFPWAQVPGYIAAQMIGAFLGAIVFILLQTFAIDLIDRERFNLVIGGVFLVIVLFSPDGLLGLWAMLRSRFGPNQVLTATPARRQA